ncbi:hypothetical protein GW17_00044270 [Ensete ventricosum]|nr:hypothetical protein GW17_00044270 [Ensete ventricosum]
MAKAFLTCFSRSSRGLVKLVLWGGATRLLPETLHAGELMIRFPGRIVCHANSFYIGLPLPVLSADDELLPGQTYFLLPLDRFRPNQALTVATLALLSPSPTKVSIAGGGQCPFAYVKGGDGRKLIKVTPDFIARVISSGEGGRRSGAGDGGTLCSTPELQKHYAQLVGPRGRPWSPALETISESKRRRPSKARLSPARLLRLQKSSS